MSHDMLFFVAQTLNGFHRTFAGQGLAAVCTKRRTEGQTDSQSLQADR